MPSLFSGVENFTPAFTGQQIANQTGAGAAQALTSGMNSATARKGQQLQGQEFEFKKKQYNDQIQRLDMFKRWLDTQIGDESGF